MNNHPHPQHRHQHTLARVVAMGHLRHRGRPARTTRHAVLAGCRALLPALVATATALAGCQLRPGRGEAPPARPPGIVAAVGHGWTSHGIDGPVYGAGRCHYRHGSAGEVLPDPRCTPGAVDTTVTAANLHATICRRGGYTARVRPPEQITQPAKKQIMAAYGIPWSDARRYELDHLIELSAGGASDTRNLWPEPNTDAHHYPRGPYVHNDKDQVEAVTFAAVCNGAAALVAVQRSVASNLTTALDVLHLAANHTRTRPYRALNGRAPGLLTRYPHGGQHG